MFAFTRARMEPEEALRKALHLLAGLSPAFVVLAVGWAGAVALAIFLLAYLAVAADRMRRGVRLPVVAALVRATSRRSGTTLRDALLFLAALVVLGLLFPLPYFLGAFAVLGLGDAVASAAGRAWGRRAVPWNPAKTWVGTLAGALAAVPAFFAFVIVGGLMQGLGHASVGPVASSWRTGLLLAVLGPGFWIVHGAAWLVVRSGAPSSARYRPTQLWSAYGVALAAAFAFLLVAPVALDGPILPALRSHGRAPWIILAAPLVGMFVESRATRGDNAWTPTATAASAYLLFALQLALA